MELEFLPHQYQFLTSQKKYAAIVASIGAGKTYAGSAWILEQAYKHPKALGGIFANTYKQLLNSTLSCLFNFLDDLDIPFNYNQNKSKLYIRGSEILCMSAENHDVLRGVELGYAWVDEAAFMKEKFWDVLVGRLRDKHGSLQIRITTSPFGYNWIYNNFAGDRKTKDHEMFTATIDDNPYLPPDYVQSLKDSYDPKLAEQELYGKFTNIQSGRIYYAFDRKKNLTDLTKQNYPVYGALDFNVNPMTATICQIYNETVHVIDEVWLPNSNTEQMAKYIKEKYGTLQMVVDSTGNKRTTSASFGDSDINILQQHGHSVLKSRNPFRIDRYNSVNSLLDKKRIIINNKCIKVIRDLEQVSYKEGTNLPDNSNSELTHISDALGYLVFHFFPLVPKRVVKVSAYA